MNIGIITAMPAETAAAAEVLGSGIKGRLRTFPFERFGCRGHDIFLIQSGMGFRNASMAAEALIRETAVDLVISTGFCGAVSPELQVGDSVMAQSILMHAGSGFDEVPVAHSSVTRNCADWQNQQGGRICVGTFVSTPVITSKRTIAGKLPEQYRNPVVEMESGAIAIVAAENGIPFVALRTVSDGADEELSFSLEEFCDRELRRIEVFRVLRKVILTPGIIPQLFRLSRGSRLAGAALSSALRSLFSAIPATAGEYPLK